MTFALDRQTAEAFYDALVSREPARIDPFLDDDVDWLIVGPIELFAFTANIMVARASLTPIGGCRGPRKRAAAPVNFCWLTAIASALIRLTNIDNRTGHEISFRVAHFARFRNGKVIEYCGIPDSLGKAEQTLGRPLDVTFAG
jgi:hypothetical protein